MNGSERGLNDANPQHRPALRDNEQKAPITVPRTE